MSILGECYFKTSNAIFYYGLKPIQMAVYSYLVCYAGQKAHCWPSMKTIASSCGCSENAARMAVKVLEERGFIRKVPTYCDDLQGRNRQINNTYYILEMPQLASRPQNKVREQPQREEAPSPPP